jgi:hypothetical protein
MGQQAEKWPDAIHEGGHAAAAFDLGWPIREISIQATKTSEESRVGICRLGIEAIPKETHEDLLRSIIYSACGPAAEYLMGIDAPPAALAGDYDQIEEDAARAFPDSREAQRQLVKRGQEAAFEVVRHYRSGIEALASALVRLQRVSGATAEQYLKSAAKTPRT